MSKTLKTVESVQKVVFGASNKNESDLERWGDFIGIDNFVKYSERNGYVQNNEMDFNKVPLIELFKKSGVNKDRPIELYYDWSTLNFVDNLSDHIDQIEELMKTYNILGIYLPGEMQTFVKIKKLNRRLKSTKESRKIKTTEHQNDSGFKGNFVKYTIVQRGGSLKQSNSEYIQAKKQLNNTINLFEKQINDYKRKSNNLKRKAMEKAKGKRANQLSPRSKEAALRHLRSKKMHNKQIESLQKRVIVLKNQKKALVNSRSLRNRVNSLRKSAKPSAAVRPSGNISHNELMRRYRALKGKSNVTVTSKANSNINHNEIMSRFRKLRGNNYVNSLYKRNTSKKPKSVTGRLGKSLSSMFRKGNKNSVV